LICRFGIRIGLLAAALLLTGFALSRYDIRAADDNYLAAVLDKDRLLRNTPSPKIMLVGGSNLAFGVDSRALQDSLGLHVANVGLYAKLGLRYMLAQAKPYIHRGDVVLIVPEYDQFYGNFSEGDQTLNTALLYAPSDRIGDFVRSYSVIDVVLRPRVERARRSFRQALAEAFGMGENYFPPDTNPVYNRRSFNEYGDAVSHLQRRGMNPDSIFVKPLPPAKTFNKRTITDLNSVADVARSRGAHAYYLFPSYIDRSYRINVASIDTLQGILRNQMRIPILGSPRDFVYPAKLFFDTRYHLTAEGRQLRTKEMIRILREVRARDGW
jgi:hypothetical protein